MRAVHKMAEAGDKLAQLALVVNRGQTTIYCLPLRLLNHLMKLKPERDWGTTLAMNKIL